VHTKTVVFAKTAQQLQLYPKMQMFAIFLN